MRLNSVSLSLFSMMLAFVLLISACGTPAASSTPVVSSHPSPAPSEGVDLPRQLFDLAKEGKTISIDFAAGQNTIAQVESQWGKPDRNDTAGSGMYATYTGHNAAFGYNKSNGVIFDVRSYDAAIRNLTLQTVKASLGDPLYQTEAGTDEIYPYNVGSKYVLKFVIPKGKDGVDHISVFSQDAVQTGTGSAVPSGNAYYLDILGHSNKLTASAWKNMQDWRKKTVAFAKAHKDDVFINGPDEKRVALTFDDGPDDKTTPAVLDVLAKYKVKGSFFFIGKQVKQYPDVVKRAYDNGHLVLSHSFKHDDLTKLTTSQIHTDLKDTEDAIAQIIGKKPAILRTPYGETDEKVVSAAKKDGYAIVLWSIDTLDWSQKERDNIVKNVVSNVRNGDIILMHSSKEQGVSAEALPIIIEQLQNKGYQIVDLQSLLGIKAYKE